MIGQVDSHPLCQYLQLRRVNFLELHGQVDTYQQDIGFRNALNMTSLLVEFDIDLVSQENCSWLTEVELVMNLTEQRHCTH